MSLYRLRSLLTTSIAYNGGLNAKHAGLRHKVVLEPGVNDLTTADRRLLEMDDKFTKHAKAGHYVEVDPAPTNAEGLRTDGPTLREYQAAGYHPDTYPPAGYAVVTDPADDDRDPNAVPALGADNAHPAAPGEAPASDPRLKVDGEEDEAYKLRVDAWQAERRKKLPKENAAAYKARMAAFDADDTAFFAAQKPADTLTDEQRQFVTDFYAMSPEDQAALKPTLSADEAALLDAHKPEGVV